MRDGWNHALFALLLLAHLALLSNQSKSEGSLLEKGILAAFMPVGDLVTSTTGGIDTFFGSWKLAGTLRRENESLRHEVDEMRGELVRLHGIEEELERLARQRSYTRAASGDSFVADVVYIDPTSWLRTLVIYTGKEEPRHNQPVVTDRGLVGRIAVPAGRYAKVLLVTDRSASVSAMIDRTRRQGLVHGDGARELLFDNIPNQADVRIGDRVITAGLDGVFPRGLPIGTVSQISPTQGLFQRIRVEPAVEFGLLDQVFVLRRELLPESVKGDLNEDGGNVGDR